MGGPPRKSMPPPGPRQAQPPMPQPQAVMLHEVQNLRAVMGDPGTKTVLGEPVLVPMTTVGVMDNGMEVSSFTFTWTVKRRNK